MFCALYGASGTAAVISPTTLKALGAGGLGLVSTREVLCDSTLQRPPAPCRVLGVWLRYRPSNVTLGFAQLPGRKYRAHAEAKVERTSRTRLGKAVRGTHPSGAGGARSPATIELRVPPHWLSAVVSRGGQAAGGGAWPGSGPAPPPGPAPRSGGSGLRLPAAARVTWRRMRRGGKGGGAAISLVRAAELGTMELQPRAAAAAAPPAALAEPRDQARKREQEKLSGVVKSVHRRLRRKYREGNGGARGLGPGPGEGNAGPPRLVPPCSASSQGSGPGRAGPEEEPAE